MPTRVTLGRARITTISRELVADHPGRFGMFTALPMPHVDLALKEIEYGLDVLKADGVYLMTSYLDHWPGDKVFAPVFEELNRRKALIYTHPHSPYCCTRPLKEIAMPDAMIEFGTDTTRAIANMIFTGTAQRCRDLQDHLVACRRHDAVPDLSLPEDREHSGERQILPARPRRRAEEILLRHGAGDASRDADHAAQHRRSRAHGLRLGLSLGRRPGNAGTSSKRPASSARPSSARSNIAPSRRFFRAFKF